MPSFNFVQSKILSFGKELSIYHTVLCISNHHVNPCRENVFPVCFTGDKIDDIHSKWFGDYELLERHHGYIQWYYLSFLPRCLQVFFYITFTQNLFEHAQQSSIFVG